MRVVTWPSIHAHAVSCALYMCVYRTLLLIACIGGVCRLPSAVPSSPPLPLMLTPSPAVDKYHISVSHYYHSVDLLPPTAIPFPALLESLKLLTQRAAPPTTL